MDAWDLTSLPMSSEHISSATATSWSEAASVILQSNGHGREMDLHIEGTSCHTPRRAKILPVSEPMRRTHADLQDATANGAYAISLLAAKELFGYRFTHQVRSKGPGFDFYLSKEDSIFNIGEARLEVSGILDEGSGSTSLEKRVGEKRRQLNRGSIAEPQPDDTVFYISVVGYKRPVLWIGKYQPVPKARIKRKAKPS